MIDAGTERTTLPVLAMLAELNLRLDYLLQTHVHDDEPNDAAALKERTGARVVASEVARPAPTSRSGMAIRSPSAAK